MKPEKTKTDEKSKDLLHNRNFMRYFRFGMIDNGLLVLSLIAGLSLDNFIASRIGVRGYGPLVGAVVGKYPHAVQFPLASVTNTE